MTLTPIPQGKSVRSSQARTSTDSISSLSDRPADVQKSFQAPPFGIPGSRRSSNASSKNIAFTPTASTYSDTTTLGKTVIFTPPASIYTEKLEKLVSPTEDEKITLENKSIWDEHEVEMRFRKNNTAIRHAITKIHTSYCLGSPGEIESSLSNLMILINKSVRDISALLRHRENPQERLDFGLNHTVNSFIDDIISIAKKATNAIIEDESDESDRSIFNQATENLKKLGTIEKLLHVEIGTEAPNYEILFGEPAPLGSWDYNPKMLKIAADMDVQVPPRAQHIPSNLTWEEFFADADILATIPVIDVPRGKSRTYAKKDDRPAPDNAQLASFSKSWELGGKEPPRDPFGRPYLPTLTPATAGGAMGRGMLDKWGPTLAGDPVVTRNNSETGELEVLLIKREDCEEWGIAGGKVNEGEEATPWVTAARELGEEAGLTDIDFSQSKILYQGLVASDQRRMINAWMETSVYHRHLNTDEANEAKAKENPKDDAIGLQWLPISQIANTAEDISNPSKKHLFADHAAFINLAISEHLKNSNSDLN